MNIEPEENLYSKKQPYIKKKTKKSKKLVVLLVIAIVFASVFFVAYYLGYIPIGFSIKEPIGNFERLDVETYLDDISRLEDMPNLDKIEYAAFGTDASTDEVNKDYQQKLESDGYHVKYSNTVEIEGNSFEVKGYLKGLKVVAILTTDETIDNYDYDSLVFYATGSALDFQEILNWYETL